MRDKLHMEIMNIQINKDQMFSELFEKWNKVTDEMIIAFKMGYKMARHQAAELVIKELKEI